MKKIKGRGAQSNPKNRFEKLSIVPDEFDYTGESDFEDIERKIETVFFKDDSKSLVSRNNSYDLNFNCSINPYRGCEHGCVYCYARPSHEYLGFSSGIDFETKITVKDNAPALLVEYFNRKNYKPEPIVFSGNTDCYQPVERKLKLTRQLLKICADYGNPVSIITKNSLITRDIDILEKMAEKNLVSVMISVPTLKAEITRILEPRTSIPERRIETVRRLTEHNISVGINIAPVIPGLTDKEIPSIINAAAEAGAEFACREMLRLPFTVKDLFINWLNDNLPGRASKIISQIKQIRNGKLNETAFGKRFSGEGELADTISNLFNLSCRKAGISTRRPELEIKHFNPKMPLQLNLFDS